MSFESEQFVELGVIGRPHGIRGEVRVFLHNPDSPLFFKLEKVLLLVSGSREPVSLGIAAVRSATSNVIARFDGIADRNEAERLKGAKIMAPRDILPEINDDEFYVHDLIGVTVVEGERSVGTIISSRPQSGIEIITVSSEYEELEIPLVEAFVLDLDMAQRKLSVTNIEDLPRQLKSPGHARRV